MPSLCLFYLFRRFLAENLKHLNQNLLLQWECSNIKTYFFLVNRLIFNFKAYSSMLQNVKLGLFSIPEQRPLLSFLEYTLGKTFLNINKSKLPSKIKCHDFTKTRRYLQVQAPWKNTSWRRPKKGWIFFYL